MSKTYRKEIDAKLVNLIKQKQSDLNRNKRIKGHVTFPKASAVLATQLQSVLK